MHAHADKIQGIKPPSASHAVRGKNGSDTPLHPHFDNRPEAAFQRKLREVTRSTGDKPIQRALVINGTMFFNRVEDFERQGLNAGKIMEGIGGLEDRNLPATVQDAITDMRLFHLRESGEDYEADVTQMPQRLQDPARLHQEVNTAPDFISRGPIPQTMRISGLISCIAIFIEAADQAGTQRLVGMHYTTGFHSTRDDANDISAQGQNALRSMLLLCLGLQITRVHLCHRVQLNNTVHEKATSNLQNLTAYFGAGRCQVHSIGQKNHVTARVTPVGAVDIDI
jgi:hypothetical protein